jgi:two-component system nitrogen regulation sensor histidine kinase NtrY
MASEATLSEPETAGFRQRLMRALRDDGYMPVVEIMVGAVFVGVLLATYFLLTGKDDPTPLSPLLVATLLVAILLPGVGVLVLVGRRVAMRRAARSVGGAGRLHVRLVAIFSILASVPTLLVVISASFLFQSGADFWFGDRARGMVETATSIAQTNINDVRDAVPSNAQKMSEDLSRVLETETYDSPAFMEYFGWQTYVRQLSEAALFEFDPSTRDIKTLAIVNPYDTIIENEIDVSLIPKLDQGKPATVADTNGRIKSLIRFSETPSIYLYVGRVYDPKMMLAVQRSAAVQSDYKALRQRTKTLQIKFNAALIFSALFVVGLAVFVALQVADRLIRPVGELVGAARRVADGDLTARVPDPRTQDEIGTLASAFNRMTRRLEEQTGALVSANAQLDSRRALIEAVMSGVSAGILSIDGEGKVRLINSSALELLRRAEGDAIGKPLSAIAPELAKAIEDGERETILQVDAQGEALTLAVRIVRDASGHILTFDDITQQLLDQRRAAWSDVARRIAHEIKNPLTPIQLAAERLQRRYGGKIESDDGVFARLTDTIIRQVGDLRRMVDEFSSFARMPKPVFREESLLDIVRQSVFLHEVANPAIAFTMTGGDQPWPLVCDRRQLGQALTNILKNAVEAIGARGDDAPQGRVDIRLASQGKAIRLDIADNGIGLPADRERLVEPYMTTRARGTGLGLAIVKKIVEEHFGTIAFEDNSGGGSIVILCFEPALLAALDGGEDSSRLERTN